MARLPAWNQFEAVKPPSTGLSYEEFRLTRIISVVWVLSNYLSIYLFVFLFLMSIISSFTFLGL